MSEDERRALKRRNARTRARSGSDPQIDDDAAPTWSGPRRFVSGWVVLPRLTEAATADRDTQHHLGPAARRVLGGQRAVELR